VAIKCPFHVIAVEEEALSDALTRATVVPIVDDLLPALRQAAAALLATAPLAVVRATLLALLAEEPAEQPATTPTRTAAPAVPKSKSTVATWDTVRRRVRAAMKQRRMDFAELGRQVQVSEITVRKSLSHRSPTSHALAQRLEAWLDGPAPEVAAKAAPFRGSSNGADTGTGTTAPPSTTTMSP
jgi:hypothetical protein